MAPSDFGARPSESRREVRRKGKLPNHFEKFGKIPKQCTASMWQMPRILAGYLPIQERPPHGQLGNYLPVVVVRTAGNLPRQRFSFSCAVSRFLEQDLPHLALNSRDATEHRMRPHCRIGYCRPLRLALGVSSATPARQALTRCMACDWGPLAAFGCPPAQPIS